MKTSNVTKPPVSARTMKRRHAVTAISGTTGQDAVAQRCVAAHALVKDFAKKNEQILQTYALLLKQEQEYESQLKTYVREKSKKGETVVVIDQPDLNVAVQGRLKAPEYDVDVATKQWPAYILKLVSVTTINPDRVELLVKSALLTPEQMQLALKEREAETPAVVIKYADEIKKPALAV